MSNNKNYTIPTKERALVLQGGGSLGAYEAGAYKGIYEFLSNGIKIISKKQNLLLILLLGHQLVP